MKKTKGEITDKPSKIDVPKGHKPPPKLTETPKRDLDGFAIEGSDDIEGMLKRFHEKREKLTKDAKQPKLTLKERTMNALLNQLIAFFKTWLYGRPVYKTVTNDKGEIEFVLNADGNKVMNIPLTILGRVMQLLGALGLLTSAIWGKTVAEWGDVLRNIITILGL